MFFEWIKDVYYIRKCELEMYRIIIQVSDWFSHYFIFTGRTQSHARCS